MTEAPLLDQRDVTFKDVTFHITKLLPMQAKQLFMTHVRPLLRGALSAKTEGGEGWQLMLAAFTDAPQEHYDAVVAALYSVITYTTKTEKTPHRLLGDEENAFKDLDMAHSLILDGRAFYINFFGSFDVILSEFPTARNLLA